MHKTSEARLGSRSPGSIPSSPTSVHSSSSAIFERDIEPIAPPSPPVSSNPHRIPRAKTTEHLDQSVPSVLDSAAEILTRCQDPEAGDQIAVVTPAASSLNEYAGRSSGFTSPIGSFRSRSPSPLGLRLSPGVIGAGQRVDLLLSIPQQNQQQHAQPIPVIATPPVSSSPQRDTSSPPYPTIQTNFGQENVRVDATPSIVTPTSAYFTSTSSAADDESSPTATSHDDRESIKASPAHLATAAAAVASAPLNAFSPSSTYSASTSHPPSPTHVAKRLSFMSYSDLLTSAPASTLPLSSFTTSASSIDPPPHLSSVSGLTQGYPNPTGSAAGSLRGFAMHGNVKHFCKRDSLFDDVGGEWEREGFGKGLEERMEELMPVSAGTSPVLGQKA
ncbi:hypothetical protein M378DRAFT_180407 [Amanita muscaria Koide BX008]|uniref:Uncharacterized protein n=1 Tax=Amanita muscaria (strain Koide BX008) TaxID=946122 RepID=A0A0C2SCA7_AMAMK|nr:hypothetical protein M378DRAFT_180407 [Amanita muscaria Koide BX008]